MSSAALPFKISKKVPKASQSMEAFGCSDELTMESTSASGACLYDLRGLRVSG